MPKNNVRFIVCVLLISDKLALAAYFRRIQSLTQNPRRKGRRPHKSLNQQGFQGASPWLVGEVLQFHKTHSQGYSPFFFSSRDSHARARLQSRLTVATETLRASAVSSWLNPPR